MFGKSTANLKSLKLSERPLSNTQSSVVHSKTRLKSARNISAGSAVNLSKLSLNKVKQKLTFGETSSDLNLVPQQISRSLHPQRVKTAQAQNRKRFNFGPSVTTDSKKGDAYFISS